MQPEDTKEVAKDLDHAYELALILSSVLSGILSQYVSIQQELNLPPIIANLRRLSLIFIFPTILMILAWIMIYFTDNKTWKMRFRTYSWSSLFFLVGAEIVEFYVILVPKGSPVWVFFPIAPFLIGFLIPVIPFYAVKKVLKRYRISFNETAFYCRKGRTGKILRYAPAFIAYLIFWLSFYLTTQI